MPRRPLITERLVTEAHQRGRRIIEVMPGSIVTAMARDTAQRLAIDLLDGPLEKPACAGIDGATAMRRALQRRNPRWVTPRPATLAGARRLSRLALFGAGGVGANVAHLGANLGLAEEIVLIDIAPGVAESTALDLNHASGISRSATRISGGVNPALLAGADVVVVSAGKARSPGMTRVDLLDINRRVIRAAGEAVRVHAPAAVVVVITNPLDEMTLEMLRATTFPRTRVLGMAGTLDGGRFRHALARAAGVPVGDVAAVTLGSHGDEMVPVASRARIRGRPLQDWLDAATIAACVRDTVDGGGRVTALRKTGSATVAPAHATIELLEHIRGAKAGAVPVSVMLDGEFGMRGVVLGVPCVLGQSGLLSVDEITLAAEEMRALRAAAKAAGERA